MAEEKKYREKDEEKRKNKVDEEKKEEIDHKKLAEKYLEKRQIEDILKNNNIGEIGVKVGDKFDPEIHEAIGGDGKKQIVKRVLQKGYRVNGRIVRAVKVEVE